jgi:hypothetical protein
MGPCVWPPPILEELSKSAELAPFSRQLQLRYIDMEKKLSLSVEASTKSRSS